MVCRLVMTIIRAEATNLVDDGLHFLYVSLFHSL